MSTIKRTPFKLPHPGPYVAVVTNNLDPTYMGGIEAVLEKGVTGWPELKNQTVVLNYLSPFYGVTAREYQGNDPKKFDDVQKSYGMWMIPPDIGSKVMCIFIEGDTNQGYWIGCVQDRWQNHMVPGIAASREVAWDDGQKEKYDVDYVPVAEFLNANTSTNVNLGRLHSAPKPVHPFADKLLKQGLLDDKIRGVTSSGARREVPSQVFGISTPGPIETTSRKVAIGYKNAKYSIPISRKGGHTFVMDDGDLTGNNQLLRIRSITGHQILLHDTNNLIYIANADGTAWIEMTAQGKIDIYAKDSVSIHTENDFNFRADRDVNIEAVRNVNIKAGKDMKKQAEGRMSSKAKGVSDGENSEKAGRVRIEGDLEQFIKGDYRLTANRIDILALTNMTISSKSGTSISVFEGELTNSAKKIYNNGGKPESPKAAEDAAKNTKDLEEFELPKVSEGAGWKGKRYQDGTITSIMQRVPMREPWTQHESTDPDKYTPTSTDRENTNTTPGKTSTKPDQGQDTGADPAAPAANAPAPRPNPNTPPDWTKDTGFINKVKALAAKLGADHNDLLAIMYYESGGTMSPSKKNPNSSATGLIQFLESTARSLGTSTYNLARMTREEQMVYVEKYFDPYVGKLKGRATLDNLYYTVFRPASIGIQPNEILFRQGTNDYAVNSYLDKDKSDGGITGREATAHLPRFKNLVKQMTGG